MSTTRIVHCISVRALLASLPLACAAGSWGTLVACGVTQTEAREPAVARITPVAEAGAPLVPLIEAGAAPRVHVPRFSLVLDAQACALIDGMVHCRPSISTEAPLAREPALLGGAADRPVRSIAFGRDFACAVMDGGETRCFGGNDRGQLGAGLREAQHPVPVRVPGARGATAVYAGAFTACAILADARVACWGKNDAGESGSSTNYLSAARELVAPEIVRDLTDVTSVAMAWDTTCAVTRSHEVYCWGRSRTEEQTAHGGESNELPTRIDSMSGTTSLVANESIFCGIKDGEVTCFGDTGMLIPDTAGAFGRRTTVAKAGIPNARTISLGANHGCALTTDGSVYCFGLDADGALGVPSKGGYTAVPPVKVADLPRVVDIACGPSVSCAITDSDEAYCWGRFTWTTNDVHDRPVKVRVLD